MRSSLSLWYKYLVKHPPEGILRCVLLFQRIFEKFTFDNALGKIVPPLLIFIKLSSMPHHQNGSVQPYPWLDALSSKLNIQILQ